MKALEEIGRAVASSLDTKAVLATIVTRAVELSQADGGAIYSYDAARGVFELAGGARARSAVRRTPSAPLRSRSTKACWGSPAKKGEPICIPDLASAPNYPLRDITLAAGFNSVLVVPLLGQESDRRVPWCCSAARPGIFRRARSA